MVMNKKNRILIWQVFFLVVVASIIVVAYLPVPVKEALSPIVNASRNITVSVDTSTIEIIAPGGIIRAEVANTPSLKEQGLSGRVSMDADRGMLFVFAKPSIYGFWMKDMNYPLDMVWMDADHQVISVSNDVATSTYPNAIFPASKIQYVLELNAGTSQNFGIATGTVLRFTNF